MTDLTKISLSGLDMRVLNPDAKVLKYTDLYDYHNVDELFNDTDKVILLYLTMNDHSGHWTCLFKNKEGINYFDSYGVPIDYQYELLTPDKRHQLHVEQDYLKKLLFNEKVCYNNITYQKKGTQTSITPPKICPSGRKKKNYVISYDKRCGKLNKCF